MLILSMLLNSKNVNVNHVYNFQEWTRNATGTTCLFIVIFNKSLLYEKYNIAFVSIWFYIQNSNIEF